MLLHMTLDKAYGYTAPGTKVSWQSTTHHWPCGHSQTPLFSQHPVYARYLTYLFAD